MAIKDIISVSDIFFCAKYQGILRARLYNGPGEVIFSVLNLSFDPAGSICSALVANWGHCFVFSKFRGVSVALKPTVYKLKITLADVDQNHYDTLGLTTALHPSETLERMMARVLAFCMNAREGGTFTKGLSATEEPDIWAHALDGQITLWIDIGEPASDRMKKAARLSRYVKVYSFNLKSDSWWAKEQAKFKDLKVAVFQFQWKGIQALAGLVKRTMDLSVTISDGSVYVSSENGECEVPWVVLQP
jgi:uncharacterized protein YaeQ